MTTRRRFFPNAGAAGRAAVGLILPGAGPGQVAVLVSGGTGQADLTLR